MTKLKQFQTATVEAALKAFTKPHGTKRFLVADEAGLGKTMVAQEIIRRLAEKKRPLRVFYVCSNLSIAHQNRTKILEFLPEEEKKLAACEVDRLTLMPSGKAPSSKILHLYTLTPETSIPMRQGKRRDGRQEERALIHVLVENAFPWFFKEYKRTFFKRRAGNYWGRLLNRYRHKIPRMIGFFQDSVRRQFQLKDGQRLLKRIRETVEEKDELEVIAKFRNALASCALSSVQPDLVIFDEFQRFRDLTDLEISEDEATAQLIHTLRGDAEHRDTALLLLSATPYRLYSTRWEDVESTSHHSEFFDLVEFLFGDYQSAKQKRQACEQAFACLEHELRSGEPLSEEAKKARLEVEQLLRPVMSRTERSLPVNGENNYQTEKVPAALSPEDLRVYKHFCDSLHELHRFAAVPYWNSIPYPIQSMGQTYTVWKKSHNVKAPNIPQIKKGNRNRFSRPKTWAHPRLRALKDIVPTEILSRPWVAPSMPWWPLSGLWQGAEGQPQKVLLFSRFRAVPPAVASLLSYDLESSLLAGGSIPYDQITKRRLLQATGKRHSLLRLFHPSPWLICVADPLQDADGTISYKKIQKNIMHRLREALNSLGIKTQAGSTARRPLWTLIGQIESRAGNWEKCYDSWMLLHQETQRNENQKSGLGRLLKQWQEEAQRSIGVISEIELNLLAKHALSAPGIVIGRAIFRHWPDAFQDKDGFMAMLKASWTGLRTYFDQRWFVNALGAKKDSFAAAIQKAILEGNLESVLDEHLWIMSQLASIQKSELVKELTDSLKIHNSYQVYHSLGDRASTFSLRCHAAMPFVNAKQREVGGEKEKPLRTDELRRAFNSPFWPHILTTTSVGQEGLDFHVWCKTLVHWDLCNNPVDLEQREGRIQRYGSLSIRKALANEFTENILSKNVRNQSPWSRLGGMAEAQMADASGIKPWWICPGADIQRYVLEVPTSEQKFRLAWLKEQRLLYRLVLGQPNQEDLLEVLKKEGLSMEFIRKAMLNLSAFDFET